MPSYGPDGRVIYTPDEMRQMASGVGASAYMATGQPANLAVPSPFSGFTNAPPAPPAPSQNVPLPPGYSEQGLILSPLDPGFDLGNAGGPTDPAEIAAANQVAFGNGAMPTPGGFLDFTGNPGIEGDEFAPPQSAPNIATALNIAESLPQGTLPDRPSYRSEYRPPTAAGYDPNQALQDAVNGLPVMVWGGARVAGYGPPILTGGTGGGSRGTAPTTGSIADAIAGIAGIGAGGVSVDHNGHPVSLPSADATGGFQAPAYQPPAPWQDPFSAPSGSALQPANEANDPTWTSGAIPGVVSTAIGQYSPPVALGTQTGQSGASGVSSGGAAAADMTDRELVQQLGENTQQQVEAANAANEGRYGDILGGYEDRYGRALETISGIPAQDQADLRTRYDQAKANLAQSRISHGLGSVTGSGERGLERAYSADLNNLRDSRLRELLGVDAALSGDTLSFMERRNDIPPDVSAIYNMAAGVGSSGGAGYVPEATASSGYIPPMTPQMQKILEEYLRSQQAA